MQRTRCLAGAIVLLAIASPAAAQTPPLADTVEAGRELRRSGRFDDALRVLRAAARGPDRLGALLEIARVRVDQGDFHAAQTACNAVPAGVHRHVCLARAHLLWQRTSLAEREIAAARAVDANDPELALVIADDERISGHLSDAIAAYAAVAPRMPGRAEPWIGLGAARDLARHPDDALVAYRHAVEADAHDPAALLALGRALSKRGMAREAAGVLERANALRPQWAVAMVALADAQLADQRADAAATLAQSALQLNRDVPGGDSVLGRARLASGNAHQAEAPLRHAIELVPNDAAAVLALADTLVATHRGQDAFAYYNRAVEQLADPTPARLSAAANARALGQTAMVRAYLDPVLAEHPDDAPALVLRADVAFDDGDLPTARAMYTRALAVSGASIDRAHCETRLRDLDSPQRLRRR